MLQLKKAHDEAAQQAQMAAQQAQAAALQAPPAQQPAVDPEIYKTICQQENSKDAVFVSHSTWHPYINMLTSIRS